MVEEGFEATQYREKACKLVSLVNRLRDAGAQYSLDLPCMVVCGNQSAGKSSLLERLCAVKLPRAAGTCTKCPTEVRLSTAVPANGEGAWQCQIKLRKDFDPVTGERDVQPREKVFAVLSERQRDSLPFYISAAQKALLNPKAKASIFACMAEQEAAAVVAGADGSIAAKLANGSSSGESDESPFTKNVVVLEVAGASVDLTLIDLPGIIQTEQGDGSSVALVEEMVREYISRDRAIIVATISCKDDIDNQKIVSMAREADPDGRRTIGELTKPDQIERCTHDQWLPVLTNKKFALRLGYYCVRNPSPEELLDAKISEQEACKKEQSSFREDPFFSSPELSVSVRQRFGVDVLRAQLSRQLVDLTQRELPKMWQALDAALGEVEEQLQDLPVVLSPDMGLQLRLLLNRLSKSIEAAINPSHSVADPAAMQFSQAARKHFSDLRDAVMAARPRVDLSSSKNGSASAQCGSKRKLMGEEDLDFWLGPTAVDAPAPAGSSLEDSSADQGGSKRRVITLEYARKLAEVAVQPAAALEQPIAFDAEARVDAWWPWPVHSPEKIMHHTCALSTVRLSASSPDSTRVVASVHASNDGPCVLLLDMHCRRCEWMNFQDSPPTLLVGWCIPDVPYHFGIGPAPEGGYSICLADTTTA